jgi:hypothetical protein
MQRLASKKPLPSVAVVHCRADADALEIQQWIELDLRCLQVNRFEDIVLCGKRHETLARDGGQSLWY